ncbi:HNH endonuclease signature motif containing protein [Glycomyces xiaoerkulensis]|uniref:HNH endonuclease signature motif containing protein n=1 Tax=Glycomyces xiaoerkulensis TaxID=2038139 RepID=UPI000C26266A|nr:HNH endonuclease signature motif containing protein [Glycomyces xiaoerkulensis]
MTGKLEARTRRAERAEHLRSELDALAAQARLRDAAALRRVLEYTRDRMHRDIDGFSGIRDWLCECFDFTYTTAGQIARIARLGPKFKVLTEAAATGAARIDAVAYAMLALDKKGLRVFARTPYPTGPVDSPYDPAVSCGTPEELIREYCVHASHTELRDAVDRIAASLFDELAMLDRMSQDALAYLEVSERSDGMWDLDGVLSADTGRLLDKYLQTSCPPPRRDEADSDGVLPAQANRNAEAFHQLVATAGTDPHAPRRHGHTATLSLVCDLETLRGEDTGRVPRLEDRPIPVAEARLLACEAGIVPMVFDYEQGELLELGKEVRLPNTALRRKLEAEQPGGCAWPGCGRPVSWCETHHLVAWYEGGPTEADNLILLCRFHHGRIHTHRWNITKTGPGQAQIARTGCTAEKPCRRCPSCDEAGRTSTPIVDFDDLGSACDVDLETEEWSPNHRADLDRIAQEAADEAIEAALAARAEAGARFRAETAARHAARTGPTPEVSAEPSAAVGPASTGTAGGSDPGPPPFLTCPRREVGAEGGSTHRALSPSPGKGSGPSACPDSTLRRRLARPIGRGGSTSNLLISNMYRDRQHRTVERSPWESSKSSRPRSPSPTRRSRSGCSSAPG